MKISFTDESWDDYLYWQKTDKAILKKINEFNKSLINDFDPFEFEEEENEPPF